ncbi:tetratricopeptide repeat protein [Vibrio vulnificus]|nr:tetratricopeptide repeat protein [Vibrio vulnificus]EHH1180365.1 tetratricopeptide repeat protein [Vibrio vulnificus]EHH1186275.1 tetratricopeptide repeat protein [Vibrio vulnificus]EHH1188567.1 tetratricopeptide repeat protein [Vibrio vulnificus]EHH2476551.1 tetratricopeptide repeat protein [Vibrio vulnificus]
MMMKESNTRTAMTQLVSLHRVALRFAVFLSIFLFASQVESRTPTYHQSSTLTYVGSDACMGCHQNEVEAWRGSHHDMAMKHASDEAVLGDFNDHTFIYEGKSNRFYQKGEEYWVNIEGSDGQWHDYKISYTFGWEPLQQFMVEFSDGRVQLIPFAWDSRAKQLGGQRWFHLYPDTTPTDEFFWTNTGQNWNFMCADCHSTNLEKNYNAQTNTYETTWSEINVACEACHGPASKHVELAKHAQNTNTVLSDVNHYGFFRDLGTAVKDWVYVDGNSTLQPKDVVATHQVQTCAKCHSRRTQLNESMSHASDSFFDKYRLSLITPELYHHDGQVLAEDYVYGSFLQSVMAEKGVTCTNCHDPHTAKLRVPEEAVCLQCHIEKEYLPGNHTFHDANTEASKCTTCHMPETTYMQVDDRRDHSWHVPRPDLSQHINTPNVCTSCHDGESEQWAAEKVADWFPKSKRQSLQHFSVAFYANSIGHPSAPKALNYWAQSTSLKDIIKASALERMEGYRDKSTFESLIKAVKDDSELIRLGAIAGSASFEFSERWIILAPLLDDPVLSIRAEAAGVMVRYYQGMNLLQREKIKKPLKEYMEIQRFNADRGFGRTNLANVYRDLGEMQKAIESYQKAIEIEPYFENSYANLADLYHTKDNNAKALETLLAGIKAQPKSSALVYAAGLAYLRLAENMRATQYLKQAAEMAQKNPHYWYVYGLALEKSDVLAASRALNSAYKASNNYQYLYAKCEVLARNYKQGAIEFALDQCLKQLAVIAPPTAIEKIRSTILK